MTDPKPIIQNLIVTLADKHNFDFSPCRALWISSIEEKSYLIVAADHTQNNYVVARTFEVKNRTITGFRVYYDHTWMPIAAVNDHGGVIKDSSLANEYLCEIINRYYWSSTESWIRCDEYSRNTCAFKRLNP